MFAFSRTSLRTVACCAYACVFAAACVCMFPTTARADVHDWSGSTAIIVTANDPGQISVSAPIAMPLALASDGTVIEGTFVELRNLSQQDIAVANVKVVQLNGAKVIPSASADSAQYPNALHLRFSPPDLTPLEASDCLGEGASPSGASWEVGSGDCLRIAMQGGFLNPSTTFTSTFKDAKPVAACKIVWTVQTEQ